MRDAIHERLYSCIFLYSLRKKVKLKPCTHHSFSLKFPVHLLPEPESTRLSCFLFFFLLFIPLLIFIIIILMNVFLSK